MVLSHLAVVILLSSWLKVFIMLCLQGMTFHLAQKRRQLKFLSASFIHWLHFVSVVLMSLHGSQGLTRLNMYRDSQVASLVMEVGWTHVVYYIYSCTICSNKKNEYPPVVPLDACGMKAASRCRKMIPKCVLKPSCERSLSNLTTMNVCIHVVTAVTSVAGSADYK